MGRMGLLGLTTGARLLSRRDAESTAAAATKVLGNLRGLAAKMGQIASYVDGIVPEEHRAIVDKTLWRSQQGAAAPTSSHEAARARGERARRADRRAHAELEPKASASASTGEQCIARVCTRAKRSR